MSFLNLFVIDVVTSRVCKPLVRLNMEPHVDSVRRKEASEEVKNQVFQELLRRSVNGVLPKSATREVATMFHLHVRTVQRF
jgi:hypothetical protein